MFLSQTGLACDVLQMFPARLDTDDSDAILLQHCSTHIVMLEAWQALQMGMAFQDYIGSIFEHREHASCQSVVCVSTLVLFLLIPPLFTHHPGVNMLPPESMLTPTCCLSWNTVVLTLQRKKK